MSLESYINIDNIKKKEILLFIFKKDPVIFREFIIDTLKVAMVEDLDAICQNCSTLCKQVELKKNIKYFR